MSSAWTGILLASFCYGANAQTDDEQEELTQFLELLNQQTSLATNTRLNADYVPGMISVLTSRQMSQRGFRTVWEALASLPGVIATSNETGMRSISIRGIGEIFEPSKVKLLLNGKALNASASATTGTLFDTPTEQIERIELIRGPGSAIYGEFAFAGVLNVITRNLDETYSLGIDSDNSASFALLDNIGGADKDFNISLNLAAKQSDGPDIESGVDRSPAGAPGNAPGQINNKSSFVSAIIDIDIGSINTLLQLQQSNRGDHFGTNNLLPPDQKQSVISETVISAAVSQPFDISQGLDGKWSFTSLLIESEQNALFLGEAEVFGGNSNEDDIVSDSLLQEQRLTASISLQYKASRNTLYGEVVVTDISINKSERFINLDPATNLPTVLLNEFPAVVDKSQGRDSISLVMQDEFRVDDRLTITGGIRFDDYEDIESNPAPRIAAVWRQSNHHIFKTQLARAFRPPSLIEESGSVRSSTDPEINDTLEFGYIYHSPDLIVRNTLYRSSLDDLIVFQDTTPFGYINTGSQELYGYELEIERSFGNQWDISSSLSLQDYRGEGLTGAAPWMLKLGAGYRLGPLSRLHLQLNSTASRDRAETDTRSEFSGQTQVDLTLQHQGLFDIDGLQFSWGVRNLLGESLENPSPADTYPDDYPYSDGALLWGQLVYRP